MEDKLIAILESHDIHGFEKKGGTDKGTIHTYTKAYERLLEPYVDKEIKLLEIGVQYGGSSLLWHDYLPKSQLVLVDVRNQVADNIFPKMDPSRFSLHIADAYSEMTSAMIRHDNPDGFDVIIDDGPHSIHSQVICVQHYLNMLKPGGILIIEDIQNFADLDILKLITPDEYKDKIEIVDLRALKGRYDDLMFVIRK